MEHSWVLKRYPPVTCPKNAERNSDVLKPNILKSGKYLVKLTSRWWFQICFCVHPHLREDFQFDKYVSRWVQTTKFFVWKQDLLGFTAEFTGFGWWNCVVSGSSFPWRYRPTEVWWIRWTIVTMSSSLNKQLFLHIYIYISMSYTLLERNKSSYVS